MKENYGLDRLIEYGTQPLPDTVQVVNPAWRKLDGKVRNQAAILSREQARFGAMHLPNEVTPEEATAHEQKKWRTSANPPRAAQPSRRAQDTAQTNA